MTERGSLYVISAPSGAGKNALLDEVRRRETRIASTVSATTRAPRSGDDLEAGPSREVPRLGDR